MKITEPFSNSTLFDGRWLLLNELRGEKTLAFLILSTWLYASISVSVKLSSFDPEERGHDRP